MNLAACLELQASPKKLLLFRPHKTLKSSIHRASLDLSGHFDEVAIRGEQALSADAIASPLEKLVYRARRQGYLDAGLAPSPNYEKTLAKRAAKRAAIIGQGMTQVSLKHIKSPGGFMFSQARADRAAEYEAARAYFRGVKDALGGSGHRKYWVTAGPNPCEECQDNEDAGPVDMDDTFDSGHAYPPLHLSCMCVVGVK